MSECTPGPWMVKHAGMQDEIWSDRGLVAELPLFPYGSVVVGANAGLIAVAPELLKALKDETGFYGQSISAVCQKPDQPNCMCRVCIRERTDAVIAKAEGRQ